MKHSSFQQDRKPHEQLKVEQLLAKLAKMQPTSSKPAPISVEVRVIKPA